MTFAVFHGYPGLEYDLPKFHDFPISFHDFPGPVVTLYGTDCTCNCLYASVQQNVFTTKLKSVYCINFSIMSSASDNHCQLASYVAARRHICFCFVAKSAFWRGFSALAPYTGVGPIQCLDEICNVHPPLQTLKIWGGGSTPRGARRPSLSVFLCLR